MSISARRFQRTRYAVPLDRTLLVRGAYVPSVTTTGPVVSSWTNQEGNAVGVISLTTTNLQCTGVTHWGEVRHQAMGIKHTNCRFAGADPDLMYAGTYGSSGAGQLVKSYSNGYYHWRADNCLFDPWLWYVERSRTEMTDATFVSLDAVSGGDCELRWCRIRNIVDGIHFMHQENIVDDGTAGGYTESDFVVPAGQRYCIVDRCLIEKCIYVAGDTYGARPGAQSDGRPHCDGIQIMQGANLLVTGSMIGGVRDSVGYTGWPNTGNPGNTGMDFANAAFMIKQEGTYSAGDPHWLTNVLIDNNFLAGGSATINTFVASGNTLAEVTVRNNRFYARQSGWGLGVDATGTPTSLNSGYGYQLLKGATNEMGVLWSGNTIYETSAAIDWPSGSSA